MLPSPASPRPILLSRSSFFLIYLTFAVDLTDDDDDDDEKAGWWCARDYDI
jgi:hypothetical protein